jgi:hypothetical protein
METEKPKERSPEEKVIFQARRLGIIVGRSNVASFRGPANRQQRLVNAIELKDVKFKETFTGSPDTVKSLSDGIGAALVTWSADGGHDDDWAMPGIVGPFHDRAERMGIKNLPAYPTASTMTATQARGFLKALRNAIEAFEIATVPEENKPAPIAPEPAPPLSNKPKMLTRGDIRSRHSDLTEKQLNALFSRLCEYQKRHLALTGVDHPPGKSKSLSTWPAEIIDTFAGEIRQKPAK